MDADGYITQMAPQGPTAPPHGDADPNPVQVMGDRFKPHRGTILGALADGYLIAHGGKPMFTQQREQENMQNAMKGFADNPMQAIRRVGTFDPDTAWKMFNQQIDNQRQQGQLDRQNRVFDGVNENIVYNRAAGMLNAATPENWAAMRDQAIKMGQVRGVDVSGLIPETYDADAAKFLINGAIPPAKQQTIAETGRHHKVTEGISQQNANTAVERNEIMRTQGGTRLGISQQNADTASRNSDISAARLDLQKGQKQGRGVQTKYGPAMISQDGNSLTLYPSRDVAPDGYDGKGIHYIRVNGQWVPANTGQAQ
jgi:hypothetical protein